MSSSSTVVAWTAHIAGIWQQRIRDYGVSPMPFSKEIGNKFVTPDVLKLVNGALKERNVPVSLYEVPSGWRMMFPRPPLAHELDAVHGNMISEDEEHDLVDPLRKLNELVYRRVFTILTVEIYNICIVDVQEVDEVARGGRLYLSYDGNRSPPFEMQIPGTSKLNPCSIDISKYNTKDKPSVESDTPITLRVHDVYGKVLWVNVGPLGQLFECRAL